MRAENECEDIFSRRSAKFTDLLVLAKEDALRLPLLLFHLSIGYILYLYGALVTYLKAECA